MSDQPLREDEIFAACLEIESTRDRAKYLDDACGGDVELRSRIEVLLRRNEESEGILDTPAVLDPTAQIAPPEKPGSEIGPYKLLQLIGEGGMGSVYMAEQTDPVERRVALKIIKPGMDSRQVIARFEAERQALAMMEHPNIATVFDAGTTSSGRPFFVMELVKGSPITTFADQHKLPTTERLRMFLEVCQAVQHAHQKGITHRDLKPSNVMVALYDERPVPKVIDFGVAKSINQRLTEKTMFTQFGQIVGTLEYMSPEQAQLNQWDVDTRSDIYSLGVLLYELLTGTTPFEKEQLHSAGFDELLRIIREVDPPRPSLRLSSSEALPSIAANRSIEPKRLGQIVRGELDWIVMKALNKDRGRRYGTATEFEADISRYLNNEPVVACPPSVSYRTLKFLRKYRGPVTAAASLLVTLVVGLAISLTLYFRAEKLRQDVDIAHSKAEQRSEELNQVNRKLVAEQNKTKGAYDNLRRQQAKTAAALERERRSAYASQVALAYNEWKLNNVPRANQLLDDCPPELRRWEWNYLKNICNSEQLTISGFDDLVRDAVFSPDGETIATIDMDGKVKLWDANSGDLQLTFRKHAQIPSCVAFSPDGARVLSTSARPEMGGQRGTGFIDLFRMMLMTNSPGSGEVLVWDRQSGEVELSFAQQQKGIRSAAFSPNGRKIATSGYDGSIALWDAQTGESIWTMDNVDPVGRIAFHPDGKLLATGRGSDGTAVELVLRSSSDGQIKQVLDGIDGLLVSVEYSKDGTWLVAASSGEVVVWDCATNQQHLRLKLATGMFGNVASISADSRKLAVACLEQNVRIWDLESREELSPVRGHNDWVTSVCFSASGNRLAATVGSIFSSWLESSQTSGQVKVWDVTHGQQSKELFHHEGSIRAVAMEKQGRYIATVGENGGVRLLDSMGSLIRELPGFAKAVNSVAFSPDGKRVAAGGDEESVRIWSAISGNQELHLTGHGSKISSVVFSPDGDLLASASSDEVVKVWDLESGRELMTLFGSSRDKATLAFSPNGKLIVRAAKGSTYLNINQGAVESSGRVPGEVRIWDADSGSLRRKLTGISGWVTAIAFDSKGSILAIAEDDRINLLDTKTWEVTKTLRGQTGAIRSLAFGINDERLVAASEKSIKVWDLKSDRETITLDDGAISVAFDSNQLFLVGAESDTVRIWEGLPYEPELDANRDRHAGTGVGVETPAAPTQPNKSQAVENLEDRIEIDDLAGALLWSVEALKQHSGKDGEVTHRTRIELLLQSLPKLGATEHQPALTPAMKKPAEGICQWRLGPRGRRLALGMYNVPVTAEEKADGKDYRYLMQVLNVQTGQPIGPVHRSDRHFPEEGMAVTHDGAAIVVIQRGDDGRDTMRGMRLIDIRSGKTVAAPFQYQGGLGDMFTLGSDRSGRWIIAESNSMQLNRHMLVWDAHSGKPLQATDPYNMVFFSPDGKYVLTGWNQRAKKRLNVTSLVRDAETLVPVGPPLDLQLVDDACFNADGSRVTVADGIKVKTFSVASGQLIGAPFPVGTSGFLMSLSPDGTRLAIASGKRIEVIDVATSQRIWEFRQLPNDCKALEFIGNGSAFVIGYGQSSKGKVQLWDAVTGSPLSARLPCYIPYRSNGHRFDAETFTLFTQHVARGSSKDDEIPLRLGIWRLGPTDQSVADLERFAQLVSGCEVVEGQQQPLSLERYQTLWTRYQADRPGDFADPAPSLPSAVPELVSLPDPPVARRPQYVELLKRRELSVEPPLLSIVEALGDKSNLVRKAAIRELQTGEIPGEIRVLLLGEALSDRSIQKAAAEALGKMGSPAAGAVGRLIAACDDGYSDAVIWALGRIGAAARPAIPLLKGALAGGMMFRSEAARALVRIDPTDTSCVAELVANLKDHDEFAFRALGRIAQESGDEVRPVLLKALADPGRTWGIQRVRARTRLVEIVASLGEHAGEAAPILERNMKRRYLPAKCRAAEAAALLRVGGDRDKARSVLISILRKAEDSFRGEPSAMQRAAEALGEMGAEAARAVDPLKKLMESGETKERMTAALALWRISNESSSTVQCLTSILNEEKTEKPDKITAVKYLGEMGPAANPAAAALRGALAKEREPEQTNVSIQVFHRDEEDNPPDYSKLLQATIEEALEKIAG